MAWDSPSRASRVHKRTWAQSDEEGRGGGGPPCAESGNGPERRRGDQVDPNPPRRKETGEFPRVDRFASLSSQVDVEGEKEEMKRGLRTQPARAGLRGGVLELKGHHGSPTEITRFPPRPRRPGTPRGTPSPHPPRRMPARSEVRWIRVWPRARGLL